MRTRLIAAVLAFLPLLAVNNVQGASRPTLIFR